MTPPLGQAPPPSSWTWVAWCPPPYSTRGVTEPFREGAGQTIVQPSVQEVLGAERASRC